MQVKSIAEYSKGSIYFRPSLSYHLPLRPLFCLFLSGRLRQVLLYISHFRSFIFSPDVLIRLDYHGKFDREHVSDLNLHMSRGMRFPTMWYVQICPVWSEPLLVPWIFYDRLANDWTSFGISKLNRRFHMLIWVYTCQNATLLEITCCGSCML